MPSFGFFSVVDLFVNGFAGYWVNLAPVFS